MRVALVTEIPAPFRIPSFNALAQFEDVDLHVYFLASADPRRQYRFEPDAARFAWSILPGRSIVTRSRWIVLNLGLPRELRRFAPDVVIIGGWNQPAFWRAARYARRSRRPLVVWIESTERDARSGHPLFERLKRRLARSTAAALVPGAAAADYAGSLGLDPSVVVSAPNAVDLGLFDASVAEMRKQRIKLREDRALEGYVVLSVGRLEHEKGTDVLVRAMEDVDGTLVVVGIGSLHGRLQSLPGSARARFVGYVPPEELPAWYAAADTFVLPSRSETWGMVLNEAASAGLPLVVTDVVGAARELVADGANGFVVPSGDSHAIAEALRRLQSDAALRDSAGRRSRELAARLTPDRWAAAVADLARRISS